MYISRYTFLKTALATIFLLFLVMVLNGPVDMDTFCFFHKRALGSLSVNAASAENIIKNIQVPGINPRYVKLDMADNVYYEPIIYFAVEGEVKEYIEPVNPVRMDSGVKIQPIEVNVSLPGFMKLMKESAPVRGQIRIRHLNGFIDRAADIEFTSQYLIERFLEGIRADNNLSTGKLDSSHLSELIMYVANKGMWNMVSFDSMHKKAAAGSPWELVMSKDQSMIMDTIAPGYRDSYFRMRSDMLNLMEQLNMKNQDIARKSQEIQMLEDRIRHIEQSSMQVKSLK